MAIKFEKIEPGMVLYDRHKCTMGNTKIRTIGEWSVRVIEVDRERRSALLSWNGNAPERYCARRLESLSTWSMYDKNVATYDKGLMGCVTRVRRLTKAEKKARADVAREGVE